MGSRKSQQEIPEKPATEAALDMVLLSARSKYSEFSQEVKRFEEKYQMDFDALQKLLDARVSEETFEQEEDLMAWGFATEAADYWQRKVEELKRAAGAGQEIL
jgi:hypothetical protein